MERIIIAEIDKTNNVTTSDITDVVYVPGFSAAVPGTIVGNYTVPEAFKPTLCTTVTQFESMFGSSPAYFKDAQNYPIYDSTSATSKGFDPAAVPSYTSGQQTQWFKAGAADISYIYAKELITAGIPVMFERLNGKAELSITATATQATYTITGVTGDILAMRVFIQGVETLDFEFTGYTVTIGTATAALIQAGNVVKFIMTVTDDITVVNFYNKLLSNAYSLTGNIINKDYQVKYLTTGGYPNLEFNNTPSAKNDVASKMAAVAQTRGDAIALLDSTDKPERALIGSGSVFNYVNSGDGKIITENNRDTFATVVYPSGIYGLAGEYKYSIGQGSTAPSYAINEAIFGGSFAYLLSLASTLKTYPSWYPIAGPIRGLVPNLKALHLNSLLTNSVSNNYQENDGVCINAITNINPYGLCIYGNRTLRDQSDSERTGYATNFLNIRNLLCDIKKQVFVASQSLMFEQNTDALWYSFTSLVSPLLDKMVSNAGLTNYKLVKVQSDSKTKLAAQVIIYPVYSVEQFAIDIVITDDEVTVG